MGGYLTHVLVCKIETPHLMSSARSLEVYLECYREKYPYEVRLWFTENRQVAQHYSVQGSCWQARSSLAKGPATGILSRYRRSVAGWGYACDGFLGMLAPYP